MDDRYRRALYNNLLKNSAERMIAVDYEDYCRDFFFHPSGGEKRLRHYGLKFLRHSYPSFEIKWRENTKPSEIPTKHLLWLANNCKQLYYIGLDKIILFDKEEAILFKMCDADLELISESQ